MRLMCSLEAVGEGPENGVVAVDDLPRELEVLDVDEAAPLSAYSAQMAN